MSKELRANLIFVCILAVLIVPGFFILMRKKLNGTSDPNYLPVPAPHSAAFNQPPPVPPSVPRVEPKEVRAWVADLLTAQLGTGAMLYHRPGLEGPVVGDAFRSQCLYVHSQNGKTRIIALIWDQTGPASSILPSMAAQVEDAPIAASQSESKSISVPKDVRHALQKAGYIDPPEMIWLLDSTLETPATPSTLVTKYVGRDTKSITETITLK